MSKVNRGEQHYDTLELCDEKFHKKVMNFLFVVVVPISLGGGGGGGGTPANGYTIDEALPAVN